MMKSGTVISCPQCEAHQLVSTSDILDGGKMSDGRWESLGYEMENAIRMGCHKCATEWNRLHPKTRASQIHTLDNGWVSLSKIKPKEKEQPKCSISIFGDQKT